MAHPSEGIYTDSSYGGEKLCRHFLVLDSRCIGYERVGGLRLGIHDVCAYPIHRECKGSSKNKSPIKSWVVSFQLDAITLIWCC